MLVVIQRRTGKNETYYQNALIHRFIFNNDTAVHWRRQILEGFVFGKGTKPPKSTLSEFALITVYWAYAYSGTYTYHRRGQILKSLLNKLVTVYCVF